MNKLPVITAVLKNKPDRSGLYLIMIRVTFERKSTYKSTGFKVKPDNFTPDGLIGSQDGNAAYKNAAIRKQISDLEQNLILLNADSLLDQQAIKAAMDDKHADMPISFKALNYKVRIAYEPLLSWGTIKQYRAEGSKIEKYKPGLLVSQINSDFINGYHRYMKAELGNSDNTVRKTLVKLHAIFEKAIELKLISHNPLDGYKMPAYKAPMRKTLSEDEQKRLVKYADHGANNYFRLVAAWFVLQMYSGLRYSDLAKWDESQMVRDNKIYFEDEKTKTPHYIPLYKELKTAIKRVRPLRSIPTNQDCNAVLKELAKLCDIKIRLTTHIARHTFAVNYLDRGGSLEVLQKLLGHNNIKTTTIYGRISSKRIDTEMKKVWG